ncbi:hypothetical protein HY837_03185 [archaeon]|nr:hypothetical protein [archaeon]
MSFYEEEDIGSRLNRLSAHSRSTVEELKPLLKKIESFEQQYSSFSNEQLQQNTQSFKQRINQGESLDNLLPEAYATVREASKRLKQTEAKSKFYSKSDKGDLVLTERTWEMVPYDVQVIGGMLLHGLPKINEGKIKRALKKLGEQFFDPKPEKGKIVEMVTGEGKTLTATLPAYLNALTGKGVHIVTTNDYLAQRDRDWMAPLYEFLGLTVGALQAKQTTLERQKVYNCDITYGANSQFGFDYLRDNLAVKKDKQVQRGHNFAIVDEVDSILIDEARTPHIISESAAMTKEEATRYVKAQMCIKRLQKGTCEVKDDDFVETGDFYVDVERQKVNLTHKGLLKTQIMLQVSDIEEFCTEWQHMIEQAIRANVFYKVNKEYVLQQQTKLAIQEGELKQVVENEVVIIDDFTGRLMEGRRWSNGLHEAIEAKELVNGNRINIQKGHGTLATVTLQNYFKMYNKLSGMTGTAETSKNEFWQVYNLDTIVLPTNKPLIRSSHEDVIYLTQKAKFDAILEDVLLTNFVGRPILIGTASLETSEMLQQYLTEKGIKNVKVLNARPENARKETETLTHAGKFGSIMIATNMAGRGADIVLEEGLFEKVSENYMHYVRYQLDEPAEEVKEEGAFKRLKNRFITPETRRSIELIAYTQKEYDVLLDAIQKWSEGLHFNLPKKANFKKPVSVIVSKEEGVKKTDSTPSIDFEVGLYVLGTERHEARRIDNQLRGRTGRQGSPGSSRFYLSLEDEIMKYFPAKKLQSMLRTLGIEEDEEISSPSVSKNMEKAQSRIEILNADSRKHALEYDEPVDKVRKWIYETRQNLLEQKKIDKFIVKAVKYYYSSIISENVDYLVANLLENNPLEFHELLDLWAGKQVDDVNQWKEEQKEEAFKIAKKEFGKEYAFAKKSITQPEEWSNFCQQIIKIIDHHWKIRLEGFEQLREEVAFVGYSAEDPVIEFKKRLDQDNEQMKKYLSGDIARFISFCSEQFNKKSQLVQSS